jgi:DNA-binding transcriptional ArsR family regulator
MPAISAKLRARLLDALAHPNRIRILEAICDGHNCNCEIGPQLDLEQSNLSRHVKILVDQGILIPERDGTRINYKVADEEIYQLLDLAGKLVRRAAERSIREVEH